MEESEFDRLVSEMKDGESLDFGIGGSTEPGQLAVVSANLSQKFGAPFAVRSDGEGGATVTRHPPKK